MDRVTVGFSEFRENLSSYVLESNAPVTITKDGDTIGFYIPAPRKRTDAERAALKEAAARLHKVLADEGLTEDELVADFKRWRVSQRK